MQTKVQLDIDISSYWHPGTGKGSGSHLDALVERDRFGLPFISGRMLKGLCRDAVNRMESWGRLDTFTQGDKSLTESLFGSSSYNTRNKTKNGKKNETENLARDYTESGVIRFSDATFPEDMQVWLSYKDQRESRQQLFRDFYSTAIQYSTGVAKKNSLRGMEMVVPVSLSSTIDWIGSETDHEKDWQEILSLCIPLIRAVGGHRTRGFGRAELRLSNSEEKAL